MRNFVKALVFSLSLHAALVFGVMVWLCRDGEGSSVATVDISLLELSLAEKEADTEMRVVSASASSPQKHYPPPAKEESPPDFDGEVVVSGIPPPAELRETEVVDLQESPSVETPSSKPVLTENKVAPDLAAPVQARVSVPPQLKGKFKIVYPLGARKRGEEGSVSLEISVSPAGAATAVRIVKSSGFPELDDAARAAVKTARFTPAKSGGKRVSSVASLTFAFKLK